MKNLPTIASMLLMSIVVVGCSKLMGGLRRDLDDSSPVAAEEAYSSPTVGGYWAERGYLGQGSDGTNRYSQMGRADRSPASSDSEHPLQRRWISNSEQDQNFRDQTRDYSGQRFSENPVSTATVSNLEPEKRWQYKNGPRATKDDFVDQSQEEGSLWASSGQTNYFFIKNKIRNPGDIVTLVIENDLFRDIGAEVKRTLSPKEKADEVAIVQDQFRAKFLAELASTRKDTMTTSAASPEKAPAQTNGGTEAEAQPSGTPVAGTPPGTAPQAAVPAPMPSLSPEEIEKLMPKATLADVEIFPLIDVKAGETMMGEIIERYPNGNYKVRTLKKIPYKHGTPRLVSVVGIVKSTDVTEDTDTFNSGKLYEYRVEVSHQ